MFILAAHFKKLIQVRQTYHSIKEKTNHFIREHHLQSLKDVALFIIITLIIHYSWRFWANQLHFAPIHDLMYNLEYRMAGIVYRQSTWAIQHLLGIHVTLFDDIRKMVFDNQGYMSINRSCSGMKQIMQFVILMMVFPGSWKKKLWFIPMGAFIVHLTNLFRITGLSIVLTTVPEQWKFSHDYIFRPFFYVVIFMMWVWWVEKLSGKKELKKADSTV